jgi:plasmid stability protein
MKAKNEPGPAEQALVQIVIPNVPDVLRARIKLAAKLNERSVAAEVRAALSKHFGLPELPEKAA